jgi:DNA-binding transcriptional regulator YdaS (Cro superfamily)
MFEQILFKLTRILGPRKRIAECLKVSIKIVNNWFTRDRKISVEYALAIEITVSEIAAKKGTEKIRAETIAPYAAKQISEFRKLVIREFLENQNKSLPD